jgi:hypothetical protein
MHAGRLAYKSNIRNDDRIAFTTQSTVQAAIQHGRYPLHQMRGWRCDDSRHSGITPTQSHGVQEWIPAKWNRSALANFSDLIPAKARIPVPRSIAWNTWLVSSSRTGTKPRAPPPSKPAVPIRLPS